MIALAASCGLAAQVSPGPLSRAHQQLEGVTKCATCHDFGAGSRGFKCLECHTEIQRRVQAHSGFHARAYKSSASQTDCARCHMEHNGAAFALVRLDRTGFDHLAQTGFLLEGKHRQLACQSCHTDKHIPPAARAEIKVKEVSRTFLGLRRECTFCHQDQHGGQLGQQCTDCHSKEAWKPAAGFNHERTHFPLTGLHQSVPCEKCHGPRPGEPAMRFTALATNGCQSCHTDPHRGAFRDTGASESCDRCHNTGGWKNSRPASKFDHSTTKFPLTGKHAERACADCHKTSDFHRPIAHDRCQDCHADAHHGQFAVRTAGADCAACHSVEGFTPTRFDREAHRQSFPLEGKHAALECAKCHTPAGRDTVYRTGKKLCADCHADEHAGQIEARFASQCQLCHTPESFQPSTFTLDRHAQTAFALTGHHASTACADCHRPLAPGAPQRQYRFASQTCNACHADPHQTKLACETCHVTTKWTETRSFDHSGTGFRLTGAHLKAKCIDCHVPRGAATTAKPDFSATPNQCFACHAKDDRHGGQFRQPDRAEDCSSCHNPEHWTPTDFRHDRTRFPLDVAHRNVACTKCHKAANQPDGKTIATYRGTPTECVRCH